MKVLHINTFKRGGAANSAVRLHLGLRNSGIESHFLSLHNTNRVAHSTVWYKKYPNLLARIMSKLMLLSNPEDKYKKLISSKPDDCDWLSLPESSFHIEDHKLLHDADIIHLHWVAGFLNYPSFFLKIDKPIVWTLHDLNPLLGIFHFEKDKSKFQDQFREEEERSLYVKQKSISKFANSLISVGPSQWMTDKIKESGIKLSEHVEHIPYGIDTNTYHPINQNALRNVLGIPLEKTVFFFVADYITNQRKGFADLKRLFSMSNGKAIFLVAGSGSESLQDTDGVKYLGKLLDPRLLIQYYACSDYLLFLSKEDNLPNTILESMACGTAVIGYNVGGSPDFIKDQETGFLVGSFEELQQRIIEVTGRRDQAISLGKNARDLIMKRFSLEQQSVSYQQIYRSILN